MKPAIEIVALEAGYGDTTILHGVSLAVGAGETVAVIGPSGSGKSTLLRAVLGLAAPLRGVIRIHGREVSRDSDLVVPPEQRNLAVVFQDLGLWPHMTAARHLDFVLAARGVERAERRVRTAEMLEQVGLANRHSALPGELSGGEQQRVAIARALVQEPAALLMDEPFSSLDVALREELVELLRRLRAQRRPATLMMIHHPREAVTLSDRIAVLEAGRITVSGSIDVIRQHSPRSPFLRSFLSIGRGDRGLGCQ